MQRAIWAGDDITGATVFRITRGMDCGPILAQFTTKIESHENSGDLLARLANDGAPLLAASLRGMETGEIVPVEQDQTPQEVAQKITVEDAHIDFHAPAFAVDRQIRACTPNPGAWCELHADDEHNADPITLHVLRAVPADANDPHGEELMKLDPGKLLAGKKQVWVGTLSGVLELLEVKAQGKKAMKAADWARGARLSAAAYCA